jgi:hypothetical protein
LVTAHHPLTAVHSEKAKKDFGHHKCLTLLFQCLTLLFLGKKVFEYMIGYKRVGRDRSGRVINSRPVQVIEPKPVEPFPQPLPDHSIHTAPVSRSGFSNRRF